MIHAVLYIQGPVLAGLHYHCKVVAASLMCVHPDLYFWL